MLPLKKSGEKSCQISEIDPKNSKDIESSGRSVNECKLSNV